MVEGVLMVMMGRTRQVSPHSVFFLSETHGNVQQQLANTQSVPSPALQLWLMIMTVIRSAINHVYNNALKSKCLCSRVDQLNCNTWWGFFFLHFLTDPFYSQAAITKRSPCPPQSQSQESTYNSQFQPRKPQQSRLVFRTRGLKTEEERAKRGNKNNIWFSTWWLFN